MSSDRRWFILENNQVNGPYENSEVDALLPNAKNPLIWGRGLTEWLSAHAWKETLKDSTFANKILTQEPLWRYKHDGKEVGPIPFQEMMSVLKSKSEFSDFVVMNDSQKEWQEIYLVEKICDELGISRRIHPRVPIMGTLTCETEAGPVTVKVISISEGGLGCSNANTFKIGDKYKATLSSPNLFSSFSCLLEVMYVGTEGYAGLQFLNLAAEPKSTLITYIKKFNDLRK